MSSNGKGYGFAIKCIPSLCAFDNPFTQNLQSSLTISFIITFKNVESKEIAYIP